MEAVIFDWGGTLSVWADVDIEDMWALAARHIAPDRADELVARLVEVENRAWQRTRTDCRSFRLAELLKEASDAVGADVAEAILEEAETHHLGTWTPHVRHQPDARSTLEELRSMGLSIGLLSNTHWPRHFHEQFLERDGLADLIDVRFYTSDMEYMKPDQRAFDAVTGALGVTDAVFVGDRLYDDVFGAQRAGMRAVWVRNQGTPDHQVRPDGIIDRLSELPALVTKLTPVS
ncbi:MAG TPA: HAD family hydrolase [Acidimicrobiales bacterium]|jgi:putative hydrolase of the HAD superfamily|nr:HAD family hydrolase [Acidimicrobiales bacterium]